MAERGFRLKITSSPPSPRSIPGDSVGFLLFAERRYYSRVSRPLLPETLREKLAFSVLRDLNGRRIRPLGCVYPNY